MSRTKEQLTEACNCECDCPADVLEVEVAGQDRQTAAALAADSRAHDALNAAVERAGDTLNDASDRLEATRKQMNGNGRAGLMGRLAPAAALSGIAGMAQERRNTVSEGLDDLRNRAAGRMDDVRGSAADRLDDMGTKTADRMDDVRTKAADTLGGVRSAAAGTVGNLGNLPWGRRKRQPTLLDRLNPTDTFSNISAGAQEGIKAAGNMLGDVLPKKRKPSLWQRLALAGFFAGLLDSFGDFFGGARKQAQHQAKMLGDVLPKKRKPSLWRRLAIASFFAGLVESFGDFFGGARKQARRQAKMLGGAKKTGMLAGLDVSKMARMSSTRSARKAEKQAKDLLRRQAQPRGGVSPLTWGLALGLGAGLMYFFDPEMGGRRRALLRDQFDHLRHVAQDRFAGAGQDLSNRAEGLTAEAHRYTTAAEGPSDRVLAERVRAQLGFLVSHPGSIDVMARGGIVTLRGPVLAAEVEPLLTRVRLIPGVTSVENHLEVHQEPGNVPGLQGGSTAQTGM